MLGHQRQKHLSMASPSTEDKPSNSGRFPLLSALVPDTERNQFTNQTSKLLSCAPSVGDFYRPASRINDDDLCFGSDSEEDNDDFEAGRNCLRRTRLEDLSSSCSIADDARRHIALDNTATQFFSSLTVKESEESDCFFSFPQPPPSLRSSSLNYTSKSPYPRDISPKTSRMPRVSDIDVHRKSFDCNPPTITRARTLCATRTASVNLSPPKLQFEARRSSEYSWEQSDNRGFENTRLTRNSSSSLMRQASRCPSFATLRERRSSRAVERTSNNWNIHIGMVHPKPSHCPLERTSTFVPQALSSMEALAVLTSRLSACFCDLSISVKYHQLKAKAYCLSNDGVEFVVQLYAGKNEYSQGVIVELQRRCGFSFGFAAIIHAILEAAVETERNVACSAEESLSVHLHTKGSHSSACDLVTGQLLAPQVEDLDATAKLAVPLDNEYLALTEQVHSICSLLEHPYYDSNLLGLKLVRALTCSTACGKETAVKNFQSIALDFINDSTKECIIIFQSIQCLLEFHCMPHDKDNESANSGNILNNMEIEDGENALKNYFEQLRAQALEVYRAWADLILIDGKIANFIGSHPSMSLRRIVRSLVQQIQISSEVPGMAATAAGSLVRLFQIYPEARAEAYELGVIESLRKAVEVGESSHAALLAEASACLASISD